MNSAIPSKLQTLIAVTAIALASTAANAAVRPHSKTIVVESPENRPVLAQSNAEAMYLQDTNDGRTVLYVEAGQGRQLTALDVTDPSTIKRIAQTEIAADGAYDFVEPVGQDAAIIRYRDGEGVAMISFKHVKRPVLVSSPALENAGMTEEIGQTGLLLSAVEPIARPAQMVRNFEVVSTENPTQPGVLAHVENVEQRLSKSDTGTLFLLNQGGITVVRQPQVEMEHQIEMMQLQGN